MKNNLGNPLIPIASKIVATKFQHEHKVPVIGRNRADVELEIYKEENRIKTRTTIAKSVVAVILIFGTYKIVQKIIQNNTEQNQSLDVQFAKRLRVAMFPSGSTWFPDGTNEKAIMNVAYAISNNPTISFLDVQKVYKKLYHDSLSVHLQKELNSEEYEKLLNVISNTYKPEKDTENPEYYSKGKMVVLTKVSSMYKELYDTFSTKDLKKNSFFLNIETTGQIKKVAFARYFNKQTRIEIKIVNGTKTVWLNADGVITVPRTKENLLKYRNLGYTMYNLK